MLAVTAVDDRGQKSKVTGCLEALNTALARKNEVTINPVDKKAAVYINAAAGYKKRAVLMSEGGKSESLQIFLERLSALGVVIQPT